MTANKQKIETKMLEILSPEKPFKINTPTLNFKHSANAGDLIYSLVGIRAACRKIGRKARILCRLNMVGSYYEGATHPLGNLMFTEDTFNMVLPLIETLDFVESIEIWKNQCEIHFNIDQIRDNCDALGMPHTEIRQWMMMMFPETAGCISEPWLPSRREPPAPIKYIAVNLTQRYRNPSINYRFLDDVGVPIMFLGVGSEHDIFIKECRKAQYLKTKNYAEVAGVIGGSKLFIGNQSSCFAVAEGMGHPRLLEVCKEATNVIPCTPNGIPFVDQKALEYLVNEAIK